MTTPEAPITSPRGVARRRLEVVAALILASAVALLAGSVLGALATESPTGTVSTTARLELLARSANATTAFLVLASLAAVVLPRTYDRHSEGPLARIVVAVGGVAAVVLGLLALNGLLLDLTSGDRTLFLRFSLVVFRLGTIALAAGSLWLAAVGTDPRTNRRGPGSFESGPPI